MSANHASASAVDGSTVPSSSDERCRCVPAMSRLAARRRPVQKSSSAYRSSRLPFQEPRDQNKRSQSNFALTSAGSRLAIEGVVGDTQTSPPGTAAIADVDFSSHGNLDKVSVAGLCPRTCKAPPVSTLPSAVCVGAAASSGRVDEARSSAQPFDEFTMELVKI